MRKLSHVITLIFLFIHLNSVAQTDIQHDTRVDAVLKQVAAKCSGLRMFARRDGKGGYVNMAVLNESCRNLKWFTCHGIAFDSVQLRADEYNQVVEGSLDPFTFYRNYCCENLFYIEQAENLYRANGRNALQDTAHNNQVVYNSVPVKSAESTLQKLVAMEGLLKKVCLQLRLFDSRTPQQLVIYKKDSSRIWKGLTGMMLQKVDSTEYFNTDPMAAAAKIVLRRQSPDKLFVFDQERALMDSVPLKQGKYASLLKEREDVFLLYRGWLELQWQQIIDSRQEYKYRLGKLDSSLYMPASWATTRQQIRNDLLSLHEQQNVISGKISRLIVPEERYVEELIADAYKGEKSEISYLPGLGFAYSLFYTRGQKVYELTDHRHNVMAVVGDRKTGIDENTDGIIEYYHADVVSANDYYPFGMQQPGRNYSAVNNYRYGYNGKENDDEVKGEGNQQDYGMRIYDPRIGRFLSVDPLTRDYPWNSTYSYAESSPVKFVDLDGLERFDAQAEQPTGVTYLGIATIPTRGRIDEKNFIRAGNYRLHGVTNNEGKQWWIARKETVDGYQDDYIVGTDAVGFFRKYSGNLEWAAVWNEKAQSNGGGLLGGFKAAWTPQNVAFGIVMTLGGLISMAPSEIAITGRNISKVTEHLKQFGHSAENEIMLDRLNKINRGELEATEIDMNFLKHELREQELMKSGKTYDEAHYDVLNEQGMYHRGYEEKLYTKEALEAGNKALRDGKQ